MVSIQSAFIVSMIKLSEPDFCPLWSRWAEGRGVFLSHFRAPRADELTDAGACEEHQADARQGELMTPGSRSRLWSGRPPIHMTPDGLTDGAFGSSPREHLSLLTVCQRKSASCVRGSFCSAVRTQRPYSTGRQGRFPFPELGLGSPRLAPSGSGCRRRPAPGCLSSAGDYDAVCSNSY